MSNSLCSTTRLPVQIVGTVATQNRIACEQSQRHKEMGQQNVGKVKVEVPVDTTRGTDRNAGKLKKREVLQETRSISKAGKTSRKWRWQGCSPNWRSWSSKNGNSCQRRPRCGKLGAEASKCARPEERARRAIQTERRDEVLLTTMEESRKERQGVLMNSSSAPGRDA